MISISAVGVGALLDVEVVAGRGTVLLVEAGVEELRRPHSLVLELLHLLAGLTNVLSQRQHPMLRRRR